MVNHNGETAVGKIDWKGGIRVASRQEAYYDRSIYLCQFSGEWDGIRIHSAIQARMNIQFAEVSAVKYVAPGECFVDVIYKIGD